MSDYYKSLVTDDEVIAALIKDSKRREGTLVQETRVRPNLNFFQRTVANLVSVNKRKNFKSRSDFKTDLDRTKSSKDYMKERIKFVPEESKRAISDSFSSNSEVITLSSGESIVSVSSDSDSSSTNSSEESGKTREKPKKSRSCMKHKKRKMR